MKSLFAAGLLVVAGCAGGSRTYAVEPTAACLREIPGATVRKDGLDIVAKSAPAGAVVADFRAAEREAYVAFGRNAEDADKIEHHYVLFWEHRTEGVLERKGNAVISWCCLPPPDELREQVVDCLSD